MKSLLHIQEPEFHHKAHIDATIIACIDYRIQKPIEELLQHEHLVNNADEIKYAGGAKALGDPQSPLWAQVQTSVSLHHPRQILIINHQNCGAYGFDDALHEKDLTSAKKLLQEKFPDIPIHALLVIGHKTQDGYIYTDISEI